MSESLSKMNNIITKLETLIVNAASAGQDTATAQASLDSAKAVISSAQASVEAQAGRDYGITVTSEATVKTDAKSTRDSLHTDLKSVHDQVVSARQELSKAISAVKSLRGATNETQ